MQGVGIRLKVRTPELRLKAVVKQRHGEEHGNFQAAGVEAPEGAFTCLCGSETGGGFC